jgi:hypothetical protein
MTKTNEKEGMLLSILDEMLNNIDCGKARVIMRDYLNRGWCFMPYFRELVERDLTLDKKQQGQIIYMAGVLLESNYKIKG